MKKLAVGVVVVAVMMAMAMGGGLWLLAGMASAAQGNPVTTIEVPGSVRTDVTGINNAGQVVGWYYTPDLHAHGFLLEEGQLTTFDIPGATETQTTGINDDGKIVGSYYDGRRNRGFMVDAADISRLTIDRSN